MNKDKDKRKDVGKETINIDFDTYITRIPASNKQRNETDHREHLDEVRAAIPGLVEKILVSEGDEVKAGDTLIILEAMKMKNRIYCRVDATIKEICVKEGERVMKNQIMINYQK